MKKIDFILETADFSHDEFGWLCGNDSIVGSFAGAGFTSELKEDSAKLMVEYFDQQIKFEGQSMVKTALQNIGWKADSDEISVSESYLTDNLISKIIYEEFKGFNYISNHEAICYSFKELFNEYTTEFLIKKCKEVFNISVESSSDAIDKINEELFIVENWSKLGNEIHDLKPYFKAYYQNNFNKEDLIQVFNLIQKA